jgi:hypothetical protein
MTRPFLIRKDWRLKLFFKMHFKRILLFRSFLKIPTPLFDDGEDVPKNDDEALI